MRKKHNKIRNTGLLYEFLLRQITADVLNKDDKSKAISIVKSRFNETTELGKELALYNIVINKKFNNDAKADYFINEVIKERKKLNNSILKREKYNLIKKIQSNYNLQKFMSSKVPNYKVFASIYKLFEYNTLSPDEKTESFFNIVEHVTTDDKSIKLSETVKTLPDDEDLRIITYRTLLEKFNFEFLQKIVWISGKLCVSNASISSDPISLHSPVVPNIPSFKYLPALPAIWPISDRFSFLNFFPSNFFKFEK